QTPMIARVFKDQRRYAHPHPVSGTDFHLQVKVSDLQAFLGAIPYTEILSPDLVAQRSMSLQDAVTGLVESVGCAITKQFFRSFIPRTNLTLIGHRESGVGRSLQKTK